MARGLGHLRRSVIRIVLAVGAALRLRPCSTAAPEAFCGPHVVAAGAGPAPGRLPAEWPRLAPRLPVRAAIEQVALDAAVHIMPVAAVAVGAVAAVRRATSQPAAGRAFSGASEGAASALDPGRADIAHEYLTTGTVLLDLPLEYGGTLQVTSHIASEKAAPVGSPESAWQEWRALRFKPAEGTTNLIQSATKVCVDPSADPSVRTMGEVLALGYTKSFVSVVLAMLNFLGAPVVSRKQGQEPLRILCIGLGGGSCPSFFIRGVPDCQVDVVELEAAVIRAATEGMGFVPGERLKVFLEDGAAFALRAAKDAANTDGIYDAVLVDAYDAEGNVPSELWSEDSMLTKALSAGLLRKRGGLVATNFLPHIDLGPKLEASRKALEPLGAGYGFSIQVTEPEDENEKTGLDSLFYRAKDTGNFIAVRTCGGPPEKLGLPLPTLAKELTRAAKQVSYSTDCPFDMSKLAARGLREWPPTATESSARHADLN